MPPPSLSLSPALSPFLSLFLSASTNCRRPLTPPFLSHNLSRSLALFARLAVYFYFGLTQCGDGGRKFAKKFAMLITTMQLLQMVVGIIVTVSSVVYHLYGHPCHVSLVNSAMGLAMYTSYFILFLQLFLDHYVFNKKVAGKKTPSTVTCPPSSELVNAMDAANKAKVVVSKDGSKAA
jgi:hypothetical protein